MPKNTVRNKSKNPHHHIHNAAIVASLIKHPGWSSREHMAALGLMFSRARFAQIAQAEGFHIERRWVRDE